MRGHLSLLLAPAVYQSVVCIPTPREVRVCPCHPQVERIVQEQVGKQRTGDTALRGAFGPFHESPVQTFHGGAKPSPNIQSDPSKIGVVGFGTFD
jgi:hypothetical protein